MNKPAHPIAASPAYDEDLYGWAVAQVRLLRAGALDRLDVEHLIEEIDSVAKSERRALVSALRVLLLHLLKWEHQPSFRSRSWLLSIREHHRRYASLLAENPSLKSQLDAIRTEAYRGARTEAVAETGLALESFPARAPGWNVINDPPVSEEDIVLQ